MFQHVRPPFDFVSRPPTDLHVLAATFYTTTFVLVSWSRRHKGTIKINFDASLRKLLVVGYGCLRSHGKFR